MRKIRAVVALGGGPLREMLLQAEEHGATKMMDQIDTLRSIDEDDGDDDGRTAGVMTAVMRLRPSPSASPMASPRAPPVSAG